MSWWDDVKFVVADTVNPAAAVARAGQPAAGQAQDAVLGQAGFAGPAGPAAPAANPVSSGSGSAGQISMSREEMEDTLRRAQNLWNDIQHQIAPSRRLTNMRSPADEPASNSATASANNAGTYYLGHLRRQAAYLKVVIDKMQKALGIVVETDEQQGNTLDNTGGSVI